ncbi:ATP-dependent DNA helicase DinG [Celerinatantimonas yamalensis]|uniref:ATP-dependent DNA helicase DinG n=1 Tax=Celerinatantimonas yamalensis TaxID=559956 RepID=A0ABW9G427_9GAMM
MDTMLSAKHKQLIRTTYQTLRQQNPDLVPRRAQTALIAKIAQNIAGELNRHHRLLLAESGTGTGKSLAYLLAAIPLTLQLNKKLIISTATVALQRQLIAHELPKVHQAMGGSFQFNLAKGRQRYCCQHKLKRLSLNPQNQKDVPLVASLWQALKNSQWQGDRDSWPNTIPDAIWQAIQSDGFSCSSAIARHRHCPFSKARQALQKAQVIVTNHSLLIADLEKGGGVILPDPEDCIYILDEAHLIPEITRQASLCQVGLSHTSEQLKNIRTFIQQVDKKITTGTFIQTRLQLLDTTAELQKLINRLSDFQALNPNAFKEGIWRFTPGKLPQQLVNLAHNYQGDCQRLQRALEQLAEQLQDAANDSVLREAIAESWLAQLGPFQLMAENLLNTLYHCQRESSQTPYAYWFEQTQHDILLSTSPLEVGGKLQAILWDQAFSVTALSATLSALGRFDYFIHQAGLLHKLTDEQQLFNPSPFNYAQVTLKLTRHFPEPGDEHYIKSLTKYLKQCYQANQATVVLCTSYQLVEQLCDDLSDIPRLLGQGRLSNQQLLTRYKVLIDEHQSALLIATTGFGEGIDLPGHYLTHLVIPRLPFAVPTDPVTQSYAELLELKGLNPFLQLTLPLASRKLIQCCGRLMRKESDSGIISILDSRIVTRRYGKQLIDALPPYHIEYIND